jgi:cytidine deaminase
MRIIHHNNDFEEYEGFEELPEADQRLLREAQTAADDAYAPYSKFHVGAAVLLENGTIVKGNNQENAAYPSGLCAERVALFAAGAHNPAVKIKAIAIHAYAESAKEDSQPVGPCGACRQVMAEYEHRHQENLRLIMQGKNGKYIVSKNVNQLLPFIFNADNIQKRVLSEE